MNVMMHNGIYALQEDLLRNERAELFPQDWLVEKNGPDYNWHPYFDSHSGHRGDQDDDCNGEVDATVSSVLRLGCSRRRGLFLSCHVS